MIWKSPPCGTVFVGPALFLDRDGVVVVDKDYLSDPDQVQLVPGAAGAMARASAAGYRLIGLSNQSGLGRGRFGPEALAAVMTRVDDLLAGAGVAFDAMYYCPHAPDDGCRCRKPQQGLLEEASAHFTWDPRRSWMVGDKASDVELGRSSGMGTVHVATGHGWEQRSSVHDRWTGDAWVLYAADLAEAVSLVLGSPARRETP